MNRPGYQFLTGAAFACHEHRRIEVGDAAHKIINLPHLGPRPDQLVTTAGCSQLLLRSLKLALEQGILGYAAQQCLEISNRWRFTAVTKGALPNQFRCRRANIIISHYHRRDL
jgi:hypothetical protein